MASATSSDIWAKSIEERKRTNIKQTEQVTPEKKIEIMRKTKENLKNNFGSVLREREDITSMIQEHVAMKKNKLLGQ